MDKQYDVVVLGGGASGMTAAIWAGRQGASVLIVEYNEELGKKILSTGNGRCNFSNRDISASCYRTDTGGEDFFALALSQFSSADAKAFFEELGVLSIEEAHRLYPRTMRAKDIRDALCLQIRLMDIPVLYQTKVKQILQEEEGYALILRKDREPIRTCRLIIATGGPASAVAGSTDDGGYYASMLGHTVQPYLPALTALCADASFPSELAGIRCHDTLVSLMINDHLVERERGELQITSYGLSGIVVFQLSRHVSHGQAAGEKMTCLLDFLPEYTEEAIYEHWCRRLDEGGCLLQPEQICLGSLHDDVIRTIVKQFGLFSEGLVGTGEADRQDLRRLAHLVKEYRVEIQGTKDLKESQVCSGGVSLREVNPYTMESKLNQGLFFAGEVLDVDGICGGYNLQWAWTSGRIAGINAGTGRRYD